MCIRDSCCSLSCERPLTLIPPDAVRVNQLLRAAFHHVLVASYCVALTPLQGDDDPSALCNRFWEAEEPRTLPASRHPDEAVAENFFDQTTSQLSL